MEPSVIIPAKNLDEVYDNFDPALAVDPDSEQYVQREDRKLEKLVFELKRAKKPMYAFLCGHRGSGKTTELKRICKHEDICTSYLPIFLTAQDFDAESVNLTHDALLIEVGLKMLAIAKDEGVSGDYEEELESWGREVVEKFLQSSSVSAEAGAQSSSLWPIYFKAFLSTRRDKSHEVTEVLEPKIADLINILDRMAQGLKNKTGKKLLVIVDDLEKGESDSEKEMHSRLFIENYDTLVKPNFSIVYTLPIYFRALTDSRIPTDQLFAFSAIHIYCPENKQLTSPPLDSTHNGYAIMRQFITARVTDLDSLFEPGAVDELIRIGGGLFRETARAVQGAAYAAMHRKSQKVEEEDVSKVFDEVKKEFQPMIRGDAVEILYAVFESKSGWVDNVEPYLQARAVVEYENGNIWLDLRHPLKEYIKSLRDEQNKRS